LQTSAIKSPLTTKKSHRVRLLLISSFIYAITAILVLEHFNQIKTYLFWTIMKDIF